jgi:hypothetical protein
MTERIPHEECFFCERANNMVALQYTRLVLQGYAKNERDIKTGSRSCTGARTGDCPVKKEESSQWPNCPHLPRHKRIKVV